MPHSSALRSANTDQIKYYNAAVVYIIQLTIIRLFLYHRFPWAFPIQNAGNYAGECGLGCGSGMLPRYSSVLTNNWWLGVTLTCKLTKRIAV